MTFVDVDADSSRAAINALREQIPTDHVILFVRRIYNDAEDPAAG